MPTSIEDFSAFLVALNGSFGIREESKIGLCVLVADGFDEVSEKFAVVG